MTTIGSALVVGGGSAGSAAAILLARGGIAVDLVEINPRATALGSGIALHGNALRVLETLGVLDACLERGYPFDTVAIRAPDPQATVLAELDSFRTGGPDLPAALGMYRPDLARILLSAAEAAGAVVRFGITIEAMEQDGGGVEVWFSDQSWRRYEVVIGADGVRSWTRRLLGVAPKTTPVGLGVWRVFTVRPAEVTRAELYYGGRCSTAGYTPTSDDTLYAYLMSRCRTGALWARPSSSTSFVTWLGPTTGRGRRSVRAWSTRGRSTTRRSRATCSMLRGIVAGWC